MYVSCVFKNHACFAMMYSCVCLCWMFDFCFLGCFVAVFFVSVSVYCCNVLFVLCVSKSIPCLFLLLDVLFLLLGLFCFLFVNVTCVLFACLFFPRRVYVSFGYPVLFVMCVLLIKIVCCLLDGLMLYCLCCFVLLMCFISNVVCFVGLCYTCLFVVVGCVLCLLTSCLFCLFRSVFGCVF